ncbi:MAG: glycosyltransferase family 9 protein [candidate division FCPU426 bacterium]
MKAHNILLVKLRAIGDSVLTLASLEQLRRGFPEARLSVLFPEHSLELVASDSRVDEAIAYPRKRLRSMKDHADFFASLAAKRFDLAVCLHASFRSALIGWMSGAEQRSIRNHSGPDWFCNVRSSEPKEPKSIIQRDFDALRALGLQPQDPGPKLMLTSEARAAAQRIAKKAGLPRGRSVLLFPGAGKPEKRWPMASFEGLAASLKKKKIRCAWVVAPGETGPSEAIRTPSLLELGALAAWAGNAIGNDSGPRHLAAASGARTLTLFGPEGLREWQPYRREDGHWALQADSGNILDLRPELVLKNAEEWLRG